MGRKAGLPPRLDVERELAAQNAVRELIRAGLVRSAHDCSEGGLAVAIAESCFNPEGLLGARIEIEGNASIPDLFNESQSRIVISCRTTDVEKILRMLSEKNIPHRQLGQVGADTLCINEFTWPIETIHDDWFNAIRRASKAKRSRFAVCEER
jgi:Phosphoribosylformylglycinamidine (FGAM) synthase, synthetase domain